MTRFLWVVGLAAACTRDSSPPPRSELSQRCIAGEDDACTVVVAGARADEYEWSAVLPALCTIGARSFCLTHDAPALAHWRAGCAAGSYLACKSATVLGDLIERGASTDTKAARRQLTSTWCTRTQARSLSACFDLATDFEQTGADRAVAYDLIQEACDRDDVAGCAIVIKTHLSLFIQSASDVFSQVERDTARSLIEGANAHRYELALTRTAALCKSDWAACGFCGERRRGYLNDVPEAEPVRNAQLSPETRRSCDDRWLVGSRVFRAALLAR